MIQGYALLIGTLALFAVLTAVMYLTRNFDWDSAINKMSGIEIKTGVDK